MEIKKFMTLGAIVVSVLVAAAFFLAYGVAYYTKDQSNISLLTGAVIASFSTVVNFWMGSSASSQKKDDAIAAATPVTVVAPREP
jgi:hypothetical protein